MNFDPDLWYEQKMIEDDEIREYARRMIADAIEMRQEEEERRRQEIEEERNAYKRTA